MLANLLFNLLSQKPRQLLQRRLPLRHIQPHLELMQQREARRRRKIARYRHAVCFQRGNHLLCLRKERILIPAIDEHRRIVRRHPRDGVHAHGRLGSLVMLFPRHHPHGVRNHRKARRAEGVDVVVAAVQNHAL